MRRLRFSAREVSMVKAMIEAHLRPLQMAQSGSPSRRAVYKFFRDTGEAGIETLILSIGDHLATVAQRVNPEHFRQHAALIAHIIKVRFEDTSVVSPPRLVDGDDLMAAFGVEPGETIGRLLEAIRESQAAGEVTDREQALALAGRMLDSDDGTTTNLKRPEE
jgi:poly(A) polymerase